MYEKIKTEIKDKYYQDNYSGDGQRFVAWYLRNIHLRDTNQAKEEVTDGPSDKQIDAIFVDDDNNKIYIIQGKFIGADRIDSAPLKEVLSSWMYLKKLDSLQEAGNNKIQHRIPEVSQAIDEDYEIIFELITTAEPTPSAKNDLSRFQEALTNDSEFSATFLLIDNDELLNRYNLALNKNKPSIDHDIQLENGKYVRMNMEETDIVIGAVLLKECIKIPGILDGTLFQKNVRQSLGPNKVNKGMKSTISSNANDFFFFHNGITAICENMKLVDNVLKVKSLSVVNGCQSLNTILSCSEKVKSQDNSHVLFRFYEIPEIERADKISTFTNSQSAVKPRDLRSNDRRVLKLKKSFEHKYPDGYMVTKRGEIAPPNRTKKVDLAILAKLLISWHSQRPNIAYNENKIFDKYFEQLFSRDYSPERIDALHFWWEKISVYWDRNNPLGFNESLLAMKSYASFHHFYAVSLCFIIINRISGEVVPDPLVTKKIIKTEEIAKTLVEAAGSCLNPALESAASESQPSNRVFSPQNWI